ncbi:MAG: hypothetical protein IT371_21580 [Deltaproteobacteria bacterium]|nr:hypothetical protein [Deltaproteobacteria bacterium]
MRSRIAAGTWCAVLLLLGGPSVGHAEEKQADLAEAKRAFKAGQAMLQLDRFAEAIVEFRKAYEVTKDGLVMGQVALAYEKAGDYEAALKAIRVYREALPDADRASVDEMIQRFERMIKEGRSKPLELPGEKPAGEAKAAAGQGKAKGGGEKDKAPSAGRKRFWTWITAGLAGALAVGGTILGISAKSKYDDLKGRCSPSCQDTEVAGVRSRAIAADVMWGLAAGAAVTATVLFFLEGRKKSAADDSPAKDDAEEKEDKNDKPEKEEEEVSQRFRLAPMVGGGTYGLGAEIRY